MSEFRDAMYQAFMWADHPAYDICVDDGIDAVMAMPEMQAIRTALLKRYVDPYVHTLRPERARNLAISDMRHDGLTERVIAWLLDGDA